MLSAQGLLPGAALAFFGGGERPRMLPVGAYPDRRGPGARWTPRIPVPGAVIAEFHTMEEKGSDVNLAAYLLDDAWKNRFEAAAVVSNDTDLVVPIRMVAEERKKPVFVVCPGRWQVAPQLRRAASHVRHIRPSMPRTAQFPDTLPGTAVSKPAGRQGAACSGGQMVSAGTTRLSEVVPRAKLNGIKRTSGSAPFPSRRRG